MVDARALDRELDYRVPPGLQGAAVPGALVACPLGPRRVLGVVTGRAEPTHAGRLVDLAGAVEAPPVPPELLALALWTARYYAAPAAAALRLVLPPGAERTLRRGPDGGWRLAPPPSGLAERLVARPAPAAPDPRAASPGRPLAPRRAAILAELAEAGGVLPAAELCRRAGTTMATLRRMAADGLLGLARERDGEPAAADPEPDRPPALTAAQSEAVAAVEERLAGAGGALLLHGVTGSGKTEVYLRAIASARARGRGSLVLVPEIALTPQLLGRLRARLGPEVAVWHSDLTPAERAASHRRVRAGAADVVVGARSAVFAPVRDLGLVVVDEEHDASYKQDTVPRYDARRVAFERARAAGATVLYGSATPRPETWHALARVSLPARAPAVEKALLGKGPLAGLPTLVGQPPRPPPRVEVVDMRTQGPGPVSRPLARALRDATDVGGKCVLLLNRRGFALMALCRACGWIARCDRCDVALVQEGRPARLGCHHCGREREVPPVCPSCRAAEVGRHGAGTQGLEAALLRVAPRARLVRLDADSAASRGAVARLLADFARPGPAILLGTQMVAKGHDLPDVTVAAVLDADGALGHADFRAEERAFALVVQLAGRAGRRGEVARVLAQAFQPTARAIRQAAERDVPGFLAGELERRRERGLPPFAHLVRLVLHGEDGPRVAGAARSLADDLREAAPSVGVLGPAPLHRLRGRFRRAILLRSPRAADALAPARRLLDARADAHATAGVLTSIDVDPQQT